MYRIGFLTSNKKYTKYRKLCAGSALLEGASLFVFTPSDINKEKKTINALFFENGKVIEKTVGYPDVLYDRLFLKKYKKFAHIYDEFKDIPYVGNTFGNGKLDSYKK